MKGAAQRQWEKQLRLLELEKELTSLTDRVTKTPSVDERIKLAAEFTRTLEEYVKL
jgi:hypothetical protein